MMERGMEQRECMFGKADEAYLATLAQERAENDALVKAQQFLEKHGYTVAFQHDGARHGEWQDIETAPKDGSSVLLYVPQKVLPLRNCPSSKWKMFSQRMIEARWIVPPPDDKSVTISPFGRDLEAKFGGYWTADPRCIAPLRGMPTHWMTLPEPPATTNKG